MVVDSTTAVIGAKFPGYSAGFKKGKEAVEKINKLYEAPIETIKDDVKGMANSWLKDKVGGDGLSELSEGISSNVDKVLKMQAIINKTVDNPLTWGWGKIEGVFGAVFGGSGDYTKPTDVGGIVAITQTSTGATKVVVNLGDPSGDGDPLFIEPGTYSVVVVGNNDKTQQIPALNVPAGQGVVAFIDLNAPTATVVNFQGVWDTNWGEMNLTQSGTSVSGTYTHDDGRITGTVMSNVLTGWWSETPSYSAPDDAGDVMLQLSEDGNSFTGRWRYGSSGSSGTSGSWNGGWTGTRVR